MLKSGFFRRLLLSYVCLLALVLTLQTASGYRENLSDMRSDRQSANQSAADELTRYVNENVVSLKRFADMLNLVPWVHKLYFDTESNQAAFTAVRKREITKEFALYAVNYSLVSRMFLIYPYRDICIGNNAWMSAKYYFGYLNIAGQYHEELLSAIRNTRQISHLTEVDSCLPSNTVMLCAPLEALSAPRAYLCFFIDLNKLKSEIKARMPDNMVYFALLNGDTPLVAVGEADGAPIEDRAGLVGWQYAWAFSDSLASFGYGDRLWRIVRQTMLLSLCGLALCWLLSVLTYRPMRAVLAKISRHDDVRAGENEWKALGEIYDRMLSEHDTIMRTNSIRRLLGGCENVAEAMSHLKRYDVPFSDEDSFQVYLLVEREQPAPETEQTALHAAVRPIEGIRYEICDTLDGKFALITAFASEDAAQDADARVRELLEMSPWNDRYQKFSGRVARGLDGVSLSFQYAYDKYVQIYRRAAARYDFPIEWENQFVSALRAGNLQAAERIVADLRARNVVGQGDLSSGDLLALMAELATTLAHLKQELDADVAELRLIGERISAMDSEAEGWETIERACVGLCEWMEKVRAQETPPVIEYVQSHFADVDLSLNTLEDAFRMSSGTINKLFKQYVGETFYAYLLGVRMSRAKALLEAGEEPIASVARLSGYENELSFRRAFIRAVGVSPKEYLTNTAPRGERE